MAWPGLWWLQRCATWESSAEDVSKHVPEQRGEPSPGAGRTVTCAPERPKLCQAWPQLKGPSAAVRECKPQGAIESSRKREPETSAEVIWVCWWALHLLLPGLEDVEQNPFPNAKSSGRSLRQVRNGFSALCSGTCCTVSRSVHIQHYEILRL